MGTASEKNALVVASHNVARRTGARYERRVCLPLLPMVLVLLGAAACQSFPPAITTITISSSDAIGNPEGRDMWRTELPPPFPVIGVRPGADPQESALFLNQPSSGRVAITLARGVQSFLLYAGGITQGAPHVIAVFLDRETAPSLSAGVGGDLSQPVTPSRAAVAMGSDGESVANHSAASVVREGYRVTLTRAAFPLPGVRVDAVDPWRLQRDGVPDLVGVITLQVEPAAAR